ncbi:MAG: Omp28-related outer membrane protein [Chitinophagaceae bacterium]
MKYFIYTLLFSVVLASCVKEQLPSGLVLDEPESYDTTYVATIETAQDKKVFIEEQTGASCVNCPQASSFLHQKENELPGKLIIMAVHSGFLTGKPEGGVQEFFNADSKILSDFLDGDAVGKPSASFDRVEYNVANNKYNLLYSSNLWPNKITEQLAKTTPVNIHIQSSLNAENKVEVITTLAFTQNLVSTPIALSLYAVESNIIDKQKSLNDVIIDDYDFNHVFRKLISPVSGFIVLDSLTTIEAGRVFEKKVTFDPTPLAGNHAWNLDNCHIIAVVHQRGNSKEVLQAEETKLK